jgi:beta propeller repeat protein
MLPGLAIFAFACTDGAPTESIEMLPAFAITVDIQETRITDDPADQFDPDISGPLIVYSDRRNADADIYMYDLNAPSEVRIMSTERDQLLAAVSGNRIVWTDFSGGSADIVMCEWNGTECPAVQVADGAQNERKPAVSGYLIVYESDENGNYDVFLSECDESGCTRHQITTGLSHERNVDISGNRIVWEDDKHGQTEIYTCVWENGACVEERVSETELYHETGVAVFGDMIVYGSNRSSLGDIFAYDAATGVETQLTIDDQYNRNPDISGTYVVYESVPPGGPDFTVRLYDLATGTDVALTTDP